ncbi:MAG: transglycosylase SLT domain-containing protein [Fimbriimonadaceae bacterium]|nr:transglycosylase SLT domain-containing protein [Fimbriimonadaceae bacterium]QYK55917.1 MAG: transglycosylase SLT domain-containing protein [Fimbriimonadaceae bacterium]
MHGRALLLIGTLLAVVTAPGQTLEGYMKLRRQYGIEQAADPDALTSFVGRKVLEVRGTVNGVVGGPDGSKLLILSGSSGQIFVKSDAPPNWLVGNSTPARLLIEAKRATESGMLEATLLGAATEGQVAAKEAAARPKPTAAPARGKGSTTSRKGGRPSPIPGDIPSTGVPRATASPANLSPSLAQLVPAYTNFAKRMNPRLGDAKARQIAEGILAMSAHFGVDARLIVAIIVAESTFDPNETSHAGAMGLGQLMPGTAKMLGVSNAYDTDQNIYGTVKLMRDHLDTYTAKTGDDFEGLVLALAAYNAGPGAVRKHGGVPPYQETQRYVRKVIAIYRQLCAK